MTILKKPDYDNLNENGRRAVLESLSGHYTDFTFLDCRKFECFGLSTETAVYLNNGDEFVFVPGGRVVLGWNSISEGIDSRSARELLESFGFESVRTLHAYLAARMSPVRSADIPPMLVERVPREIGWHRVSPDDPEFSKNKVFRETLEKFINSKRNEKVIPKALRLRKKDGEITAELYKPVSYKELISSSAAAGFRLPTEDEWEYFCGGGCRTIWRWGDSFNYGYRLRYFGSNRSAGGNYDLEKPNQFGLRIANDPCCYEVLMDSEVLLKGGDGGKNIGAKLGPAAGYLPAATYYRCPEEKEAEPRYLEDIGSGGTCCRRIKRLDEAPLQKKLNALLKKKRSAKD
ncbi:SUMF1/EgtB/PvdO family nonheme iron enzyme [Breznakiella homolactica]|nr:SUMF1/EgtB/PvdO family nonheme iron enzyme [Breznakiella homolactica]QQO10241.2 formylglycine-generating enzyme family protein [Breznakiella homolactica]